ncbi:MAG: flavin reductase family protein [Clostridia bacterium]|nr:flavin reductase family protein [Clostridia bacterium]
MNKKLYSPEELDFNAFNKIGKEWMLISAYSENAHPDKKYNTMTASWGGVGVLWNKNVFFCFVRPQRFTKKFIDDSDTVTLSFFGEEYKPALTKCGRTSGKDTDKIAEAGLTAVIQDGSVFFEQAKLTVVGKKLFAQYMDENSFIDKSLIGTCYPDKDYHMVYVCEIKEIYGE